MKRPAIRVIIPTTAGPRRILALRPSGQLPCSQVYRQSDLSLPLDISGRYHNLVGPNSPLKDWSNFGGGSWRLIVDDDFDTGRSWEVPVALAHWLYERGCRLDVDDPEFVIWSTGVLDVDLNIVEDREDHYHMSEKIKASAEFFRACADGCSKVRLIVPKGCRVEAELALVNIGRADLKACILEVASLPQATDSLALCQRPKVQRAIPFDGWLALAVVVLGSGIGWPLLMSTSIGRLPPLPLEKNDYEPKVETPKPAQLLAPDAMKTTASADEMNASERESHASPALGGKPSPSPPEGAKAKDVPRGSERTEKKEATPTPVAPRLEMIERRAPADASCAAVFMRGLQVVEDRRMQKKGHFPPSAAQGLCGLGFRLLDGPARVTIRLGGALAPYVWDGATSAELARGGPPWTFNLRLLPERDLAYEINVTYRTRQGKEQTHTILHVINGDRR